jgi:phage terminase large subunit-like protein
VFGTLKPNGYRQFNTAYVEIPKKMGKSELAAAVALLLTCGDNEERAEVYGCAADRNQASIVFNVAADMVRMCPALVKRVKILDSMKRLIYQPSGSAYQVLSADVSNKHGFNTHGVVFDELHTQPNRKLYDVMTKGSGDARMQPLYFLITTAGDNQNSICWEVHSKALDILNSRKHDATFYPVIYGAGQDEDWTDPSVWKKANPSLGITVGMDKVKAAFESARQNPAEENAFRQLRLNQWVKQSIRWMPMEKWDKCAFPVDTGALEGRVCYGGLDLSSSIDITAFVLVFPPAGEDSKYSLLPFFWIPENNIDLRVRRDHVPYDTWQKQGFLLTTEGNVVHYGFIETFIEDLGKKYNIREIAFDRWGAVQIVQNLEGLGFTVVPFGQGFKDMSPPTKELMKLTLEGKLAHGGHPVLRWMMDNIFIRTDPAGNIKPDKEKSTEKIDGAVAAIMALDRAIRCGNQTAGSVYDAKELLIL